MSKSNERAMKKRKRSDSKSEFKMSKSLTNPKIKYGPEKKNFDAQVDVIGGTGAGTLANLFLPAQGVSQLERIGRKTLVKSIEWRFTGGLNIATATTGTALRFVILYDNNANGADPAITDVFENDNIQSFRNANNSKRFITIHEEIVEMVNTVDTRTWYRHGYKKLNLLTEWSGATGEVASITSGSFIAVGWQDGSATTNPATILNVRFRFTDV